MNNLLLDSNSASNINSLENDWIDNVDCYCGKTQKRKDNNGNLEYKTIMKRNNEVLNIIEEKELEINNQKFWQKISINRKGHP